MPQDADPYDVFANHCPDAFCNIELPGAAPAAAPANQDVPFRVPPSYNPYLSSIRAVAPTNENEVPVNPPTQGPSATSLTQGVSRPQTRGFGVPLQVSSTPGTQRAAERNESDDGVYRVVVYAWWMELETGPLSQPRRGPPPAPKYVKKSVSKPRNMKIIGVSRIEFAKELLATMKWESQYKAHIDGAFIPFKFCFQGPKDRAPTIENDEEWGQEVENLKMFTAGGRKQKPSVYIELSKEAMEPWRVKTRGPIFDSDEEPDQEPKRVKLKKLNSTDEKFEKYAREVKILQDQWRCDNRQHQGESSLGYCYVRPGDGTHIQLSKFMLAEWAVEMANGNVTKLTPPNTDVFDSDIGKTRHKRGGKDIPTPQVQTTSSSSSDLNSALAAAALPLLYKMTENMLALNTHAASPPAQDRPSTRAQPVPESMNIDTCIQQLKTRHDIDLTRHIPELKEQQFTPVIMPELTIDDLKAQFPGERRATYFVMRKFFREYAGITDT
ncbi:hypothetical protein FRC03_002717 [Tulasnella sp. 419]|nr:hypothetical protein FRC03_002717 [Tulasnella sp. 419]